jgi:hypothetical protein
LARECLLASPRETRQPAFARQALTKNAQGIRQYQIVNGDLDDLLGTPVKARGRTHS